MVIAIGNISGPNSISILASRLVVDANAAERSLGAGAEACHRARRNSRSTHLGDRNGAWGRPRDRFRCQKLTHLPPYLDIPDAETARAVIRQKKIDGYEAIKVTEFLPPELLKVVVDEAHAQGMGVFGHSWDVFATADTGIDGIEHIWSVGYSSILDVEARNHMAVERTAGRLEAEVMAAQYQTENYDVVIDAFVRNGTAWTPTVAKFVRPFSSYADRFWEREQEVLNNPDANLPKIVRVITEYTTKKLFEEYSPEDRAAA